MIKKDNIMYGTSKIEYTIHYAKRKTATIIVYPYKDVEIIVPENTSLEKTKKLIKKKSSWIIKKIDFFNQIAEYDATKEYVEGETILYLGRQYRIKIINTENETFVKLKGKYLEIVFNKKFRTKYEEKKYVKTLVINWYKKQAEKNIKKSLVIYSKKLGLDLPIFKIKNQIKRWGSCTSKDILNFNLKIMMAPKYQFDYVIVHELCHIKHKNHSNKFWNLVGKVLNDYELRKEQLKEQGNRYEF
jgi:predicted metal-dependent hydrolase